MSAVAPTPRATIAICGGGLIGTSLALALGEAGHRVAVADLDASVRSRLAGLVSSAGHGDLISVHDDWRAAAENAEIVVAAVPPSAIPGVLAVAAEVAAADALFTDVAGVKAGVVQAVHAALASSPGGPARFVGGHPMAGSERSGPEAGDAGLFTGATWILTPTEDTEDRALAQAGDLARGLGARVLVLRPDEHDVIVGLVSHLPQLVASVLADVAAEAVDADREAVMAVAGPGFRDTTRIAASDASLWVDIVDANRPAILAALAAYTARLREVVDTVDRSDLAALETFLHRASAARRRLVPKDLSEPTSDLRIPLRDRPGEIARITGALGSAGINIEDLAMRHATAADRGSLLVRIRTASVERASDALADADVLGIVVESAMENGSSR
jgi:prephenate dehydrogenase